MHSNPTSSHQSIRSSLWLLAVLLACYAGLCSGSVTVTDSFGHTYSWLQTTPLTSFPQFSIPAQTAVIFTISATSDVSYVNIHVAIPGQTVAMTNSTYNYVARLNATNRLPFGTDMVTASQFINGTTVYFTVGWQSGSAAVDTRSLFVFSSSFSSSAVGDPQFAGFLGQNYQIHGVANQVYSIISDALVQVNAMFVFLTKGHCPPPAARLPFKTACWSHAGSYLGRLTLQTLANDSIDIVAGAAGLGFTSVVANGAELQLGEEWRGNALTAAVNNHPHAHHLSRAHCSLVHSHVVRCHVGLYELTVTNSDGFLNLHEVAVSDWTALTHEVQSHGLLGQTWRRRSGGEVDGVEGSVDDYAEQDNDMFGTKTHFNRHRVKVVAA